MTTLRSLRIALALPLALAACSEDTARSTGGGTDASSDTQADTAIIDSGADTTVDSGSADTSSEDTAVEDTAPDGSSDTGIEDTTPDGSADADTGTEDTSPPSTAIVISELMKDPCAVSDGVGEWFEVTNISAAPYDLRGVVITDDGSDRHTITGADPILVAPGATFLLAASGDAAVNGGLAPGYVYSGLLLANGDDAIILTAADGSLLDAVRYTRTGFPNTACASLALADATAGSIANDDGAGWCNGSTLYNLLDAGTPGATNSACPAPPSLDRCRLVAPLFLEARPGDELTAVASLIAPGLTDRTTGTDTDARLRFEVGFGTNDTTPDAAWIWSSLAADTTWAESTEPALDQYAGSFAAPATGSYDVAARVSLDNGLNWTLCDLATDGSDGSLDGYQPGNAGQLTVLGVCDPNPCNTPPPTTCNLAGSGIISYGAGSCTEVAGRGLCDYPATPTPCATGRVCIDAICTPPPSAPTVAGEVIVSEFMPQSSGGTDNGEWVELHNTTTTAFNIRNCILGDGTTDAHTIARELIIPAGGYRLLARSADPVANHGLTPDYIYSGFSLRNTTDSIILTCGGTEIDRRDYTAADVQLGISRQLDSDRLDGAANDVAANWCESRATYGTAGKFGTPGSANRTCGPDPVAVDWCRLQAPASAVVTEGASTSWSGRLYIAGLTTLTTGIDPYGSLRAEVGFGPAEVDPTVTPSAWNWAPALPSPGYNATTAGEPNNDEYVGTLVAPAPQSSRVAFRFSGNGGSSWTYCDRNTGPGADGAENGFALADAGTLLSLSSAICEPNPCTIPLPDYCADGFTAAAYLPTGVCAPLADGTPECTFETTLTNCLTSEQLCSGGLCIDAAPAPSAAGALVFTEVMAASQAGSGDRGEWFEIANTTAEALDLSRCTITDDGSDIHDIAGPLVIAAGGRLLLARSAVAIENHGITPDYTYAGITLGNTADALNLTCDGLLVDRIAWTAGFSVAGTARQLDRDLLNADANDLLENWCAARTTYGTAGKFGSPGEANASCAPVTYSIDWCRLQFPTTAQVTEGNEVTVYGRFYSDGLTTLSLGNDPAAEVSGQVGYGPIGSDPGDPTWSWFDATPNATWDSLSFSETANDEYQAQLAAPAFGATNSYDFAFRFSGDSRATWTYCDRDAGAGSDGAQDGYQPSNAGDLTVLSADICIPNPCAAPPANSCINSTSLLTQLPSVCSNNGAGGVSCDYPTTTVACAADEACTDGACVTTIFAPAARGDLYFTEVMAASRSGTGADAGEWFELRNATAAPLNLEGCELSDAAATTHIVASTLVVGAGQTALFARNAAEVALLGATAAYEYRGITLNNTGESLFLRCGDLLIDEVTITTAQTVVGTAIQLSPARVGADANDSATNWCLATTAVPSSTLLATPGTANALCGNEPLIIGWCRLQWPLDPTVAAGTSFNTYGRLYIAGLTDRTSGNDPDARITAQAGFGDPGTLPDTASWSWTSATPEPSYPGPNAESANDEYSTSLSIPADRTSNADFAFRFSGDGGTTWTYCDRNAGPGADGAEGGYQPANAGIATVAGACAPNPCLSVPDDSCADGATVRNYSPTGTCSLLSGSASCDYTYLDTACGSGLVCLAGACSAPPPAIAAGEVVFTELLARGSQIADNAADDLDEFIELYNTTSRSIDLAGCTLDATGVSSGLTRFTLPAGTTLPAASYRALFRASPTAIRPPGSLSIVGLSLPDDVTTLSLTCAATLIDGATIPASLVWAGVAAQLDPTRLSTAATDSADDWCAASTGLGSQLLGTPGAVGGSCPSGTITGGQWCRLQYPEDIDTTAGTSVALYGRLYLDGISTRSDAVNPDPRLRVRWGFGPAGSDPAAGSWTWKAAVPNAFWNAATAGETNNDEYWVESSMPAADGSPYAHAFSMSRDAGATWIYCDRNAGGSSDGYADGYQIANAGSLLVR
jgi:hypothetical protein